MGSLPDRMARSPTVLLFGKYYSVGLPYYMKVVILNLFWGGAYGSGASSIQGEWSGGLINRDSYRSWVEINGIFDRYQKFSFSGSGGRLKVEITSENRSFWLISLIVFHWIYNRKIGAPDFETTYLRPKWNFSNRPKNSIKYHPWTVGIRVYRSGPSCSYWRSSRSVSPPELVSK